MRMLMRLVMALGLIALPASFARATFGVAEGPPPAGMAAATLAGGCFWCMEPPFDKLDGVVSTISGYIGGTIAQPTYQQVSAGGTNYVEAVRIVYDPAKISYDQLLDIYWRNIDPTVLNRQFCDVGDTYRTAIFYNDDAQKQLAEASKAKLESTKPFKEPIVTAIEAAGPFWPAEDYHQNFYQTNPLKYKFYRWNCGRDQRLQELWGSAATH